MPFWLKSLLHLHRFLCEWRLLGGCARGFPWHCLVHGVVWEAIRNFLMFSITSTYRTRYGSR